MSRKARRSSVRHSRLSRRQVELEWGSDKDELPPEPEPADDELPGTIFAVPDRWWEFEAIGREDHPGICTACRPEAWQVTLVKGRDATTDRTDPRLRLVVEPTRQNKLRKLTAFALVPLYRPLRRVRLLYANRRIGTLEADVFAELRRRLTALFPLEG
jgi:hypothetical protein